MNKFYELSIDNDETTLATTTTTTKERWPANEYPSRSAWPQFWLKKKYFEPRTASKLLAQKPSSEDHVACCCCFCCCCCCCCCCVLRNQNQTASTLSFDLEGANLLCRSRITLDAECCQKLFLMKEKRLG